eukprot:CAMPEP_0119339464 /NCGR_PEP_ID=MMETSP1333-20130426/98306_1 /TAXON_ID=418940 /ORGANISM="Scyphosphaera apsteinii, Strain RCC1455" /LENGTH=259 /DNA_ID=CAMNT_0007350979 /DNA_START=48 /DNA_END=824 /DNA_ORIENTATION=+
MPTNKITSTVTLSVYFEGTANTISPITTQVGMFFATDAAINITDPAVPCDPNAASTFKMGFNGCGVDYGMLGTIFAVGLQEQCETVMARVRTLLNHYGCTVRLVCLGLSRGGIGGLMLAKQATHADGERLHVSLCLFDPVPGNLICTARWLDLFKKTTVAGCMDLTKCNTLRRILAIYPYEPLPDFAFHAPVLPNYPSSCEVEEDATLGCHQGALYPRQDFNPSDVLELACWLSCSRIFNFMQDSGVCFAPKAQVADSW